MEKNGHGFSDMMARPSHFRIRLDEKLLVVEEILPL